MKGLLGFQIHMGEPMKVEFRNIWLKQDDLMLSRAGVVTWGWTLRDAHRCQPGRVQLPDAPGKDETVRLCGTCHEPQRAAAVRLTREGWHT